LEFPVYQIYDKLEKMASFAKLELEESRKRTQLALERTKLSRIRTFFAAMAFLVALVGLIILLLTR